MNRTHRLALAVLVLLLSPVIAGAAEVVTIPGSGSCQMLLREAGAAFMKANPDVKIEIPDSSGTGGGYKSAGEGTADAGRVSRPANDKEKPFNLDYLVFARTPIVFVAHPSVKVGKLSAAQLRDLFTGKVANWSEVGGPDLKVRIIGRHPTEANFNTIKKALPEWKDLLITEKSKLANTDQEVIAFVSEYEGSIGFGPMADAEEAKLRVITPGGAKPLDPAYPMVVDAAFAYKPAKMAGAFKKFADFLFTPEGAKIIEATYSIPVKR